MEVGEEMIRQHADDRRTHRKGRQMLPEVLSAYMCARCGRDYHSREKLPNHCTRCTRNQ
ncbi:hypothetical protein DPMN_117132 [Dreissena polymorpha]|uniref:C2H2-type domain-containing protein n=1 Tax=Dreissena polymorpha TaxID=45954 RepID=A0A9D4KPY1_DREPO|nr:hypothetical protein DPMN_117132 [Dreissena polymorpha]